MVALKSVHWALFIKKSATIKYKAMQGHVITIKYKAI